MTKSMRPAYAFALPVAAIGIGMLYAVVSGDLPVRDAIYAMVAAVIGAGGAVLLITLARSKGGSPPGTSNGD